ncbi:MAG: BLUF domain-containing protein [Methylophaga sp.]|nr:BLUF domain-containing protein [Methylophaga sp.]
MTRSLLRILYSSKTHARLSETDLTKLLLQSRENNQRVNVNGILCYNHTDFIQVLEGPENTVINLYQKILKDDRHHECKLINISLSNKYIFKNWSMGYIDISHGDMRLLREELPEKLSNDNADIFAYQLKTYLNKSPQKSTEQIIYI